LLVNPLIYKSKLLSSILKSNELKLKYLMARTFHPQKRKQLMKKKGSFLYLNPQEQLFALILLIRLIIQEHVICLTAMMMIILQDLHVKSEIKNLVLLLINNARQGNQPILLKIVPPRVVEQIFIEIIAIITGDNQMVDRGVVTEEGKADHVLLLPLNTHVRREVDILTMLKDCLNETSIIIGKNAHLLLCRILIVPLTIDVSQNPHHVKSVILGRSEKEITENHAIIEIFETLEIAIREMLETPEENHVVPILEKAERLEILEMLARHVVQKYEKEMLESREIFREISQENQENLENIEIFVRQEISENQETPVQRSESFEETVSTFAKSAIQEMIVSIENCEIHVIQEEITEI